VFTPLTVSRPLGEEKGLLVSEGEALDERDVLPHAHEEGDREDETVPGVDQDNVGEFELLTTPVDDEQIVTLTEGECDPDGDALSDREALPQAEDNGVALLHPDPDTDGRSVVVRVPV
jgi:hypothetical protein